MKYLESIDDLEQGEEGVSEGTIQMENDVCHFDDDCIEK